VRRAFHDRSQLLEAVITFLLRMAMPPELLAEIDSCRYLALREITELGSNSLRLRVEEELPSPEAVSIEIGGTIISDCHSVRRTKDSQTFDIVWKSYVSYMVTNELFSPMDGPEQVSSGRQLRIYTKSHFLDFVSRTTIASSEYPGPLQHIAIITNDHIIDVVSVEDPHIRKI
jgi:hypothetical protein